MKLLVSSVQDLDGTSFSIKTRYPRCSIFAMSVHKAGSSLFDSIVESICDRASLPYCDFSPQMFTQGISDRQLSTETAHVLDQPSVVFSGFRGIGILPTVRNFRTGIKLLLVRDPRDIVVSLYHSVTKSHAIPEVGATREETISQREVAKQLSLNDFVGSGAADFPVENMRLYMDYQKSFGGINIFKYEDIIYKKRSWVSTLSQMMSARLTSEEINEIADKHDVIPDIERPDHHIRQVHPGNFRAHLSAENAKRLEHKYCDVFSYYDFRI